MVSAAPALGIQCGMIFIAIYFAIAIGVVLALGMAAGRSVVPPSPSHDFHPQYLSNEANHPFEPSDEGAETLSSGQEHEAFVI